MRFSKLLLCGVTLASVSLNAQAQSVDGGANPAPLNHHIVFSEALSRTNIQRDLENSGDFTVFAPSDTAFKALLNKNGDFNVVLKDTKALRSIVAYHIVAGQFTASRILKALCRGEGAAVFTTIQGEQLIATLEGVDIVLTDCSGNRARIIKADTGAENLLFHEIDQVILPSSPIP